MGLYLDTSCTLSAKSAIALMSVVNRTLAESPYDIAETPSNVYSVAAAPWAAPCIAGPWIGCTWQPWKPWACGVCSPTMRSKVGRRKPAVSKY